MEVSSARLRVRYAETDKMGVVYYANYLVWFEVGRTEWLRACGPTYQGLESEGIGLPVIEASCHYHLPGRYDDEIDVATRGELLSPARVRFAYEVIRVADAAVLARGHTVHAVVDNRTGRPCRLPEEIRTLFA